MKDVQSALARLLRPVIRVLIDRGVRFPELSDWVKEHYLWVAEHQFRLENKRVTDSRLHLLTGLQRKDIKAIRDRTSDNTPPANAGPTARIIGIWLARHSDPAGNPKPLARLGPDPSFQALVEAVSRDMHLRTVQDELVRVGLATVKDDTISLTAAAYLPAEDDGALLGYFGANLGDHAAAAADNVLAAPEPGPHLERAVHYNRLTPAALEELDTLSRNVLNEALMTINTRAAELQNRDQDRDEARGRFRAGAFIYRETSEDTA